MENEVFKCANEIFNCKSLDNFKLVLILLFERFKSSQFHNEVHKMRRSQHGTYA